MPGQQVRKRMRCDTCKKDSPMVMRVVVDQGYNRALARPLYNCPACFEKKEEEKQAAKRGSDAAPSSAHTK